MASHNSRRERAVISDDFWLAIVAAVARRLPKYHHLFSQNNPNGFDHHHASSGLYGLSRLLCLGVLAGLASLFIGNGTASVLIDRPLQSFIIGIFFTGLILIAANVALRRALSIADARLDPTMQHRLRDEEAPFLETPRVLSLGKLSYKLPSRDSLPVIFGAIIIAIIARLFLFNAVLNNHQCVVSGIEALLPLVIFLCERWRFSTRATIPGFSILKEISSPKASSLLTPLAVAALVTASNFLTSQLVSYPSSTFICPLSSHARAWAVWLQLVSLFFDSCIFLFTKGFLGQLNDQALAKPRDAPFFFGVMFIIISPLVAIMAGSGGLISNDRAITAGLDWVNFRGILWSSVLFAGMTLFTIRTLLFESAFELSFLFSGIFILTGAYNGLRSMSYIPRSFYSSIPPVLLLILAISLYSFSPPEEPSSRPKTTGRRLPRYLSFILYIIFMVIILLGSFPSIISAPLLKSSHPIDGLMHGASKQHDRWSKQAFTSRDLNDAAREYVRRYNRVPPPGFREWYEFSVAKNSSVIDDFDSIHENLLPFWALAPKTIRGRVKYIVDDRWNECAVVKIRSGAADLRNVQDTHRWMMEGIIRMMDPFIKHLPDMNIPFNVNDESRVAVPYDILDRLRKEAIARKVKDPKTEYFSNDRARQWNTTEPEPVNVEDASFKRNFRKFGSISCPPSSFARQYHAWDPATLCTDCIGPHSDGIFLKNWTLAASPCHQPDLANLHGFYISPSAFKTVRDLVPIFSQSRPHGYSDILYPSAWNYNDKVKYAPSDEYPDLPFEEKKNTLFWRGTTTEGYSNHAEWRGMVRQRLVHLANNSTIPSPILLPSPSDPSKLSYQSLLSHQLPTHPSLVHSNLSLSLGFVSEMVRCETAVCVAEELEFGLRPGNDFQYHWSNRYLMDVDGAGFSGRFLPFLQSHSLPFKSALFREWYDDRLVAWKHFVPVDLRLHGLWSTLAYFAGNFRVAKKEILKDASATEAARAKAGSPDPGEAIAEAGREWANKVLRKEDMEIYFFRLLLEWGRLTDDRRDDIGFIM